MNDVSKEGREDIMRFQQTQQQLQMMLVQKQNIQVQIAEMENALGEIEKTDKDKIYEIIGNVMIKKSKDNLSKSLKDKKKMLDLRTSTIDKQIKKLKEKATELQKKLSKQIK